jgi:predicted dithiol-disulfide oxidoreductase (DUF899 family)
MATIAMAHRTGTREEWLKERLDLLKAEKELTRKSDELARRRQELPWVKLEKDYRFDTEAGQASLKELFRGRSQLIVYHFMFGADYKAGCPSCSAIADGFNGFWEHLAHHDVMLWAISRAPLQKLLDYRKRMGWTFPWASSDENGFNLDFQAGLTEAQLREEGYEYNFQPRPARPDAQTTLAGPDSHSAMCGVPPATYTRELPGVSAFVLDDGEVYHTYSAYSRGLDALWGMYPWLDRAPLGRNEAAGPWWKRRDEYGAL